MGDHGVVLDEQSAWDLRMKLSPVEDIHMKVCDYEKFVSEYCSKELSNKTMRTRKASVVSMVGSISYGKNKRDLAANSAVAAITEQGRVIADAVESTLMIKVDKSLAAMKD